MSQPHHHPSRSPGEHPSDELVLAAIERAALHDPRRMDSVPVWGILEHLGLSRRSGPARHVGTRLEAMATVGWLDRARRHGVPTWALTDAGARRLRDARRKGDVPALPESPQHRAWRLARVAAGQELERFRADVRERVERALGLLDAEPSPHSDVWLEHADELQRACRRVGSASYCLREWAEPDDDLRDVDERVDPADATLGGGELARRRARRGGRRNIRLWDERDAGV
jgi:hypothetical protein